MPENPYQNMAKEFLDLWQKQMASMVSDKQFIHAMLELLHSFNGCDDHEKPAKASASYSSHATGMEPHDMGELAFRLAMCEKRLAKLEAKKSPGTTKRTRKRSKKSRK